MRWIFIIHAVWDHAREVLAVIFGTASLRELFWSNGMTIRLPAWGTTADVWRNQGNLTTPTGPRTLQTLCNLARGEVLSSGFTMPTMYLLVPLGTAIFGENLYAGVPHGDLVECPVGSGHFYKCLQTDEAGYGFPNAHRFAVMTPVGTWATGVGGGELLLEDGTAVLLEDGTPILLE